MYKPKCKWKIKPLQTSTSDSLESRFTFSAVTSVQQGMLISVMLPYKICLYKLGPALHILWKVQMGAQRLTISRSPLVTWSFSVCINLDERLSSFPWMDTNVHNTQSHTHLWSLCEVPFTDELIKTDGIRKSECKQLNNKSSIHYQFCLKLHWCQLSTILFI